VKKMAISNEQAIKAGFLFRCAEEGLTREETHVRIKQAIAQLKANSNVRGMQKEAWLPAILGGLAALSGGALSLGGKALSTVPALASLGTTIGIAAPVIAGAGTGYLAAKLTGGTNKDGLEEAKQDEIVNEYERLADEAKRRAVLKRIQAQTGKRIVPLSPSLGV
jgi:hypothetical protein